MGGRAEVLSLVVFKCFHLSSFAFQCIIPSVVHTDQERYFVIHLENLYLVLCFADRNMGTL